MVKIHQSSIILHNMLVYFVTVFSLYYLFCLLLLYGWRRASSAGTAIAHADLPMVSVVISVRNEADNIARLLRALEAQDFPKDRFEVIVVDDHSGDNTMEIVQEFAAETVLRITTDSLSDVGKVGHAFKKAALLAGIAKANGELLAMTDGDCWMGEGWLRSMVRVFANPTTMFAAGPVTLAENRSLFSKIQSLEFSSLIGSGAAMIRLGYPLMCNGANLTFRKSAFEEVGGYDGFQHHPSGDDVFLMQKMHFQYGGGVVFVNDAAAMVHTDAVKSVAQLVSQRRRWASKWRLYPLKGSWILPVFLFIHYLGVILLLLLGIAGSIAIPTVALLLVGKAVLDFVLLWKVRSFFHLPVRIGVFLLAELVYPFYAIGIGVLVHFGFWNWKGRKHKS
jgi:biofilm PGA synthesis N-glycosyltransferase PgaC